VSAVVRDVLYLPRRFAEQLVRKVGQGPRGRDLLSDLGDLRVSRIPSGKAVTNDAAAAVLAQPRLGPRLPVFLVE